MPTILFSLSTTAKRGPRRNRREYSTLQKARNAARRLNAQRAASGQPLYIAILEHYVGWSDERCRRVHLIGAEDLPSSGKQLATPNP